MTTLYNQQCNYVEKEKSAKKVYLNINGNILARQQLHCPHLLVYLFQTEA